MKEGKDKKLVIISIISISISVALSIVLVFTIINTKNGNVIANYDKQEPTLYNEIEEGYEAEEDYPNFQRTESWYNDPVVNGNTINMPDLAGLNCETLKEYLNSNYLYFINDIEYKCEIESDCIIPTTIISTIPTAGTELNPETDKKITVLANYQYLVNDVEFKELGEDFETKNFGKKMKVQVGNDENNYIEGIIGENFIRNRNYIEYKITRNLTTLSNDNNDKKWERIQHKEKISIPKSDITFIERNKYAEDRYVKCKIWIEDEMFKEFEAYYNIHGSIIDY